MEIPPSIPASPEDAAYVAAKVASGRFGSPAEVVREALQVFEQREAWLEDIREKLAVGLAQAEAGELIPGEEVFAELRARHDAVAAELDASR